LGFVIWNLSVIIWSKVREMSLKKLIRGEKGQALILALILLAVGGLILAPLLAYMRTGLTAGGVCEVKMDELYAADAGVEDAVLKIQHKAGGVGNLTKCYPELDPYTIGVNNKTVEVRITYLINEPVYPTYQYRVVSTATGDGSGTKIEAYVAVTVKYYPSIMDQLITIQGDLTPQQVKSLEDDLAKLDIACPTGCTECGVCGQAYNYSDYDKIPAGCRGCVAVYNFPTPAWPTVDSLSSLWSDAQNQQPDNRRTIDLNGSDMTLEPLKRLGDLTIKNSGGKAATLTLTGSVYITGQTLINGANANEPYDLTVDMKGHTIFVSNNTSKALEITQCNVKGPGIIIALGDIKFAPKLEGGITAPVYVLSLLGTTSVFPSGDIYGAIGGKTNVNIGSGTTPSITYPAGGFGNLTLPFCVEAGRTYSIASWEVSPL
jgi:hypothetical protein